MTAPCHPLVSVGMRWHALALALAEVDPQSCHTVASLMAQQGVPVSAAAAALGHDPAIFLRTYAHLYPGDLRGVADAMDLARHSAREGAVTRQTGQISRGDFAGTNRPAEFPSET